MTTQYFLNVIAGNVFGSNTSTAIPTNYYLGLSTTAPNYNGTGFTEPPAAAGYTRVQLTNLSAPNDGVVKNNSSVEFNESTSSWNIITHFLVFDAPTDGNLLQYGELPVHRTVEAATMLSIPQNYLSLSFKNPS